MESVATESSASIPPPVPLEIVLLDLSSIARPIWEMNDGDSNPNAASTKILEQARALTSGRPTGVAFCCDLGRSFRRDMDPAYKANRPDTPATYLHQIALVMEALERDGFPVWAAAGFEADDLIASAVTRALQTEGLSVLIVTSDKDLLQLVGPRVSVKSATKGTLLDPAGVVAKFGVEPKQMIDYLTLVGDTADNIPGCKGIGEVKASALLTRFGSLENLYAEFNRGQPQGITPDLRTKLMMFREQAPKSRALIQLRTDAPVPFEELGRDRVPIETQAETLVDIEGEEIEEDQEPPGTMPPPTVPTPPPPQPQAAQQEAPASVITPTIVKEQGSQVLVRRGPMPGSIEWAMQLEPRTINEAISVANAMFQSRYFTQFGTPQGVLAMILSGRELGMPKMVSLRAFDSIDNRPTLKARAIHALVIQSGQAKYFRMIERTNEAATFETQRGDNPPVQLRYTVEDARRAWTKSDQAWNNSGWTHNPADMCVARSSSKLANLVYPDVTLGLYASEEFE